MSSAKLSSHVSAEEGPTKHAKDVSNKTVHRRNFICVIRVFRGLKKTFRLLRFFQEALAFAVQLPALARG